ncbi:MAG TPA: hypothetical protein VM536_17915 [Chloroflexia bacterium]|nr:hypothetical protein [Chloroflexia bacterium]
MKHKLQWVTLGVALLLLGSTVPAHAHGGKVWLNDDYGAFRFVVQTAAQDQAGVIRMTVVLFGQDFGPPVPDATVRVRLVPQGLTAIGGSPTEWEIPPEAIQEGYYDTPLPITFDGEWEVTITARRGDESGTVSFPMAIDGLSWPRWLLVPAGAVLVGGGILAFRRRQRARTPSSAPR